MKQINPEIVVKRDGIVEGFDRTRIENAIQKAFKSVGRNDYLESSVILTDIVIEDIIKLFGIKASVEQIQNIVEDALMREGFHDVAKAYILYRRQHEDLRNMAFLLSSDDLIDSYLDRDNWLVRENANMSYSLQGLNNFVSSKLVSEYWLSRLYPSEIGKLHKNGDFHIHDLGILGAYCVGWDLRDLLLVGFRGARGKIESKPARHFRVALGQIVNFFYTIQGEAAGAQAMSNLDTYLAPFIKYDGLNYEEIVQAIQEFIFNMNVPTRVGFQTPFTNITLDITVPSFMNEEPVIIGGEVKEDVYGDFQEEMDLFNKAFCEVMFNGDGNGRVFTFPIITYNVTSDFPWEFEELWKTTAKYGTPYFSNFINSDMRPEDVRSMCCRLRIDNRELKKRGGGFFGANPLTGSLGVVTINLPRIAYLAKSRFFEKLDELMDSAKSSLETKRKVIERMSESGLYPYSKFYLRHIHQSFGKYWKNHFSTIGLVGMNEACLNLLGVPIYTREGSKFARNVLEFMRNRLSDFQEGTGNIYNLEATPAEGTSHRLAMMDKQEFPDIIVANEDKVKAGAAPFYTNSTQLPVDFHCGITEAFKLQDPLQTMYTGGTVFHMFMGESYADWRSVSTLIRKSMENFHLPYITFSPTFSICPSHGYLRGREDTCPICEEKCEVWSRIVGYLRPVDQWNDGKQAEFNIRETFSIEESTIPSSLIVH
jgi:anaerobic ribonucleoside-triphosphate reductase